MKKLTRLLVSRFIQDHEQTRNLRVRARYGALEGWVSITVNVLLFAVKLSLGLAIQSISLIADAIHTLADSATSLVIIIGFKIAGKPSDREHPFGHGKMEHVAALIVSILLFVAGIELLKVAAGNIIKPSRVTASWTVIAVITVTLFIKHLLSRFSFELGDIIDSKALKADALHHMSDVLATGLVVIALVASRFGLNRVDGIMGVGVSLIIFWSAYAIAREAINPLLGEAPSKETIQDIENLARSQKGVLGVHDIIYHQYGSHSIISLHIEVSDKEPVAELHAVSETIEDKIVKKMGGMAIVHIDPINKDHPQYENISKALDEIITENKQAMSFHELRIVGTDRDKCNVLFDLAVGDNVDEKESAHVADAIRRRFHERFPLMKTFIKTEPKYVYNTEKSKD